MMIDWREGGHVMDNSGGERYQAKQQIFGGERRPLSASEVNAHLRTKWLGHHLLCYSEVDSTNQMAKICIARQEPRGTVIVAETQTAGRGRLLRQWVSHPGVGLWFSVILSPFVPPNAALLSFLAGVSVCRVIREVTGLAAELKWPNDVLIGDRKVCGILLEVGSDGESVVVGIGLNVNQQRDEFPVALQDRATSLALEAGHPFDRPFLLAAILNAIENRVETFLNEGSAALMDEYRSLCTTIGKRVRIDFPDGTEEYGVVSGIADNGAVVFIPDVAGGGGAANQAGGVAVAAVADAAVAAGVAGGADSAAAKGARAAANAQARTREIMAGDITHLRTHN